MKERRFRIYRSIGFFLLTVTVILLCVATIFEYRIYPLISAEAVRQTKQYLIAELTDTIVNTMTDTPLIRLNYQDGLVTSVETDTRELVRLQNASVGKMSELFRNIRQTEISVPVGSLFGSSLLYAKGFSVTVKILSAGHTEVLPYSDFTESGINQTLHRLYLRVTVEFDLLCAREVIHTSLTHDILAAETIIIGHVPDAYTEINRYTIDDIEEGDLNDYSAALPED